jgi:hypothetical protein
LYDRYSNKNLTYFERAVRYFFFFSIMREKIVVVAAVVVPVHVLVVVVVGVAILPQTEAAQPIV